MNNNMSGRTIVVGALMMALGVGFYLLLAREVEPGKSPSPTALIPTFIGLPILALGFVARNPLRRKHAMHGAAALSLLGLLGSLMSARKWPQILTGQAVERPLAAWEMLLMFLICSAFLAMCIQSFRAARRGV